MSSTRPVSRESRTWFASHRGRTCSPGWVTLVSWDQRFFDPIMLPGRKPLVTLRDAAQYIRLPKAERELPEWETAIEWLMLPVPRGKNYRQARRRAAHR